MTVSEAPQSEAVEEWLSVHDACALIGVSPATLRRWSAAGDVPAFTTPGGHRRFARSTILGLLPSAGGTRPDLAVWGQTPEHMTRVYRRHLTVACGGMSWLNGLDEDAMDLLRLHGRAIAGSLLRFLDAPTPESRRIAIGEALDAATEYGRIAARGSAGIRETVETFQRFRTPFVGELVAMSRRRGLDTVTATDLLVTAAQAIDELMIALISGHQHQLALNAPTKGST